MKKWIIRRGGGSGSGYTAIMTDYLTRLSAEGGSLTTAEKGYLNTLTQNADIGEFDRLWVHGLSNQIAARISLVNALTADLITEVNAPTWTANEGYMGNGTTQYLDSNYNAAVDGIKYTQNSNSNGFYGLTASVGANQIVIGSGDGTGFNFNNPNFTNGVNSIVSVNSNSAVNGSSSSTTSLNVNYRTNSTHVKRSRLGVLIDNIADVSNPLININFYILGRNQLGGLLNPSDIKISLSFFGSGAINQAQFYSDIQALGTSIGWAV